MTTENHDLSMQIESMREKMRQEARALHSRFHALDQQIYSEYDELCRHFSSVVGRWHAARDNLAAMMEQVASEMVGPQQPPPPIEQRYAAQNADRVFAALYHQERVN